MYANVYLKRPMGADETYGTCDFLTLASREAKLSKDKTNAAYTGIRLRQVGW